MIVKNEIKVLPRLFKSLCKYIDCYLIVDTGSTDGTQTYIKDFMHKNKIPGGLYERDWVNFGHNRQIALDLAIGMADYLMIIDADEELVVLDNDFKQTLNKPSYTILRKFGSTEYRLPFLIDIRDKNAMNWKWNAPVHNYLTSNPNLTQGTLLKNQLHIISYPHEGAKSHDLTIEEKYLKDADLLEKELLKNPNDTRSMFYLAQSYKDAKKTKAAKKAYLKVVESNGWSEERFYSYYQLLLYALQDQQLDLAESYALKALYINRNRAAEITYPLMKYYRLKNEYKKALFWGDLGFQSLSKQDKSNYLFVNNNIYSWVYKDDYSLVLYYTGDLKKFKQILEEILPLAPQQHKARLIKNKTYAK